MRNNLRSRDIIGKRTKLAVITILAIAMLAAVLLATNPM
jgi:hypothetical protein